MDAVDSDMKMGGLERKMADDRRRLQRAINDQMTGQGGGENRRGGWNDD